MLYDEQNLKIRCTEKYLWITKNQKGFKTLNLWFIIYIALATRMICEKGLCCNQG